MSSTPAGWYTDPDDAEQVRYWDGVNWTDRRQRVEGPEPMDPVDAPTDPGTTDGSASRYPARGTVLSVVLALLVGLTIGAIVVSLAGDSGSSDANPPTLPPGPSTSPSTSAPGPTSTDSLPTESTLPPLIPAPPIGDAGRSTAEAEAGGYGAGSVTLGDPEVTTGATLTHFSFSLEVDNQAVGVEPVRISIDANGDPVSRSGPQGAAWVDEDLRRADEWDDDQLVALARATIASGDDDEFDTAVRRIWVPADGELHDGAEVALTAADSTVRWVVTVDAAQLAVVDVRAEVLRSDGDCEPAPAAESSGCVATPDPNGRATAVELDVDDPSGTGGLDGGGVTVWNSRTAAGYVDDDGVWNTSTDDEVFPAVNAFHWTVTTRDLLADLGFPQYSEPELAIFISDQEEFGLAYAQPEDRRSVFGVLGDGRQTAADAQVVVHELAHHLLYQAAPSVARSAFPESGAYNEANADLVTLFMAPVIGSTDLDCMSRWLESDRADGDCLRRYRSELLYPDDFYATLATEGKYAAGRVWTSAVYSAFSAEVEAAGGSVDDCTDPVCAELARRFLMLLAESWPMTDVSDFTLPQAAQAAIVANDALGVADADRLRDAFDSHGLLTSESRAVATLLLAHDEPAALSLAIDVTDGAGTVRCALDPVAAGGPVVTIDISACESHLPATNDSVWRATIRTDDATTTGRVLEFAVSQRDGTLQATRPSAAVTGTVAGSSLVVTIPDGVQPDLSRGWRVEATSLSGVGLSETENVVLVVELLAGGPELVAYDLATGDFRWQSGTYSYGASYTGIAASFVMFDSHAVVLVLDDNGDPRIRSLALSDGATRWQSEGDDVFSLRNCGGWLCVRRDDGRVERLDPADGAVLGEIPGTDGELLQASIGDRSVSMSEGSTPTVRVWDVESGATVWSTTPGESLGANTAGGWHTQYRESLGIYLVSIGPRSELLSSTPGFTAALDAQTGAVLWVRENTWLPTGFPSGDDIYLISYDVGFGLGSSVEGRSIERVNPATGSALATVDEIGDPFLASLGFSADGSTIYWRDDGTGPFTGGRDMRTGADADLTVGLAWERVDRSAISAGGDERSVPDGHQPVDLTTGEVAATTQQPEWIGATGSEWTAHVTPSGAIAVAQR